MENMSNFIEFKQSFLTQTWSGNIAMCRLAEKIGFVEIE